MDEILCSFIVVTAVGIVVVAILVITGRKKQENDQAIEKLAMESGWRYEKINQTQQNGFILNSQDWMLEALTTSTDSPSQAGSSDFAFSNTWRTTRKNSPTGIVMIGHKLPLVNFGGLGESLIQDALRLMVGDKTDPAFGIHEVFIGRTAFRDRFSVWATSQEVAEKLLSFELENALLNWKFKDIPNIIFKPTGVEIVSKHERLDTVEKVQAMVDLGKAVLGD